MTLIKDLTEHICAAFSGIVIETAEPHEAQRLIAQLCHEEQWKLIAWDLDQGSVCPKDNSRFGGENDPIAPLKLQRKEGETTLTILHNYHLCLLRPITCAPESVVQALANAVIGGKHRKHFFIVLAPPFTLPPEIAPLFVTLEHRLPERQELATIAQDVLLGVDESLTPDQVNPHAVDAALGMTRNGAENAFALSVIRQKGATLHPDDIWTIKAKELEKSGLFTLHRTTYACAQHHPPQTRPLPCPLCQQPTTPQETFERLGGLHALKTFCLQALAPQRSVPALGVLLLGVPGTGKSFFCKALGHAVGWPTAIADPGAWKSSLVGESGHNTRRAFRTARAMGQCVFMIDEVEKALAGATGYQGDSGVSADQLGVILTEMANNDGQIFYCATSNNVSALPPEFLRQERWDAIFFLDFPGEQEKDAIWTIYQNYYNLPPQKRPTDHEWTGAEIKSCCRLARLTNTPLYEAAQYVIPVSQIAAERVQSLRRWATGRAIDATRGGVYHHDASEQAPETTNATPQRRALTQRPNAN